MATKLTTKKALFGNRRSHSCKATRHAQKPNLQKVTLENGETIILSARELRTLKKASSNKVAAETEMAA
jgi:ribosomal protein L28